MESGSRHPEEPGPEGPEGPQAPAPKAPPVQEGSPPQASPYTPIPDSPETPPSGWDQPIVAGRPGWEGRQLASWGSRVGATLIDWLILLIPTVILFIVVLAGTVGDDDTSTGAAIAASLLYVVLVCVILLLYAPVLMMRKGSHNGQTFGKQLVGITVVRNNGEPMNFGWAALREVVFKGLAVGIASTIIPLIPWLLDVLWPLWDDENRALHDFAALTHVVKV